MKKAVLFGIYYVLKKLIYKINEKGGRNCQITG